MLLFFWLCSRFYVPGKGFTYLIEFGDRGHELYLPQLRAVDHYELKDSHGYDAQSYAQIAMQPRLSDPALKIAVDDLPYRARRILLPWFAYALAGGNALWALHIFATENLFCWIALAVLLWRWLPPVNWNNFFRWAAILFSFGLSSSVRGSLPDGPSLLMIACAAALVEVRKLWFAAAVLGVAVLARETNLLAVLMLIPPGFRFRRQDSWLKVLLLGGVAILPLTIWTIVLHFWLGPALDPGARNLTLPLTGYLGKWREILGVIRADGFDWVARGEILVLVALTAQWCFIVLRPRWSEVWWRIAAPYALLAAFLGEAVWEGYPGAATRVLLPLSFAFNLLVPARRWGLLLLLIGNVSLVISYDNFRPPGRESSVVTGPRELRTVPDSAAAVDVSFDRQWYDPEKSLLEYWRWSMGDAVVTFHNPHPFALLADISFGLRAKDDRVVGITIPGRTLWLGKLEKAKLREIQVADFLLPPGDTQWKFETTTPPVPPSPAETRPLTFSLRNLKIALKTSQSPPAAADKVGR